MCAEVFLKDGGEGQRHERERERERESCFMDLAVHHSMHRLVFLNYAKLYLQRACQRVHL